MESFKLGQVIPPGAEPGKDAIHMAIAPALAGEPLRPSQHVRVYDGVAYGVNIASDAPIGIVDPFLQVNVPRGARFWLFLYPGTITSLRHEWTHPAFSETVPVADKEEIDSLLLQADEDDGCSSC